MRAHMSRLFGLAVAVVVAFGAYTVFAPSALANELSCNCPSWCPPPWICAPADCVCSGPCLCCECVATS